MTTGNWIKNYAIDYFCRTLRGCKLLQLKMECVKQDTGDFNFQEILSMKYKYTLIRSSRKTVALQIRDGEIIVRGPMQITRAQADDFVKQHESWIEKHLKEYEVSKKEAAAQGKLTRKELNDLIDQAYRVIPQRVQYYAERIGVTYGRIAIHAQHTRWGSCSSNGNLNFNCLLVLMPQEVLDSVVVHELCHRKEMNHSSRFYDEVYKAYPEYDLWTRWIKENGGRYIAMLPDN